jgi:nitroimidazol reductase NimA-like FMN-containing flavoprotein (pyridoxamine 5'-phosphate oxidase superfamily)
MTEETRPMTPPRTRQQRTHDALQRLEHDIDAWVATADRERGIPYMVPLSFLWDGTALLLSTASSTPTSRNLQATGTARVGIGTTRDVVLIEGTVEVLEPSEITAAVGDAFAAKTGFDPRRLTTPYLYFRMRPRLLQAWREVNELEDRDLMRDGRWVGDE